MLGCGPRIERSAGRSRFRVAVDAHRPGHYRPARTAPSGRRCVSTREGVRMHVARWVQGVVLALAVTGSAGAQTHPLIELPQPNDCYRVELAMRLTGEMKVVQEGKPVSLKLAA